MLVTINTDASFCPDHKIGGYAFWITSNEFRIKQGDGFKNKCINSTDAEMKCIVNAFHRLAQEHKRFSKIIVNTDSESAIQFFTTNNRRHLPRSNRKIEGWIKMHKDYKNFLRIQGMQGLEIEFRHVKAHSGTQDKRSFVNKWCDQTAKYFLGLERRKLRA